MKVVTEIVKRLMTQGISLEIIEDYSCMSEDEIIEYEDVLKLFIDILEYIKSVHFTTDIGKDEVLIKQERGVVDVEGVKIAGYVFSIYINPLSKYVMHGTDINLIDRIGNNARRDLYNIRTIIEAFDKEFKVDNKMAKIYERLNLLY